MELIQHLDLTDLIKRALAEDIGQGDVTTAATVAPGQPGTARITVKEDGGIVFCGAPTRECGSSRERSRPRSTENSVGC